MTEATEQVQTTPQKVVFIIMFHLDDTYYVCMLSGFSHVRLFVILWTEACQAALSVGFLRQEYWLGLPFPPPGDLPDPGIEPASPALAGRLSTAEPPGKPRDGISSV